MCDMSSVTVLQIMIPKRINGRKWREKQRVVSVKEKGWGYEGQGQLGILVVENEHWWCNEWWKDCVYDRNSLIKFNSVSYGDWKIINESFFTLCNSHPFITFKLLKCSAFHTIKSFLNFAPICYDSVNHDH